MSAKPESSFKKSARAVQIGMALGVAAFILSTLLTFEIASAVLAIENPSVAFWPLLKQDITAPLLLAPLLSYLAGLLIEGPRWTISASLVVTLQVAILLVLAVSVGPEEAISVPGMAIALLAGGVGVVLSGWAMKLAQRRKPEPKLLPLAAIDFEKVKEQAAAPLPAASPLDPAASRATDHLSPPAALAPAAEPSSPEPTPGGDKTKA